MIPGNQADGGEHSSSLVTAKFRLLQIRKYNNYVNAMLGGGPAHISPSDPAPQNNDLKNCGDHLHFSARGDVKE